MKAQMILMRHSKRSPARCINSTAYHVIKDVVESNGGFPVVSQGTIDSDMQVTSTPKVSTRGPRKGQALASGAADVEVPDMSVAMKIVIARMNPASKYSLSTGNRWPVATQGGWHAMIRGFAKAYGSQNAFAMAMDVIRPIAERMVKARHSSTGFLKKSWIDLKVSILPFAMGNSVSSAMIATDYSEVTPAKEGNPMAVCTVSNTLGVGNRTTRELSEKYNEANHRIAEPRIQAAINREFDKKVKMADAQEWARDEPELRVLGLLVKP
jgi:hypothetical protein